MVDILPHSSQRTYNPFIAQDSYAMTQIIPLDMVLHFLDSAKADHLVTIPLDGKSYFADYMVIASGTSNKHTLSIADFLVKSLKNKGFHIKPPEGHMGSDWILLDLNTIIVHIFRAEIRDLYALERMWSIKNHTIEKPILIYK